MAVNIILAILLVVVGAVIGWRLSVIDNKLDWILDAVTDYEELVKSLEDELTKDDWRNKDNAGKEGWAFVIDITKANGKKGIEIRVPYGTIGFSKDIAVYNTKKERIGVVIKKWNWH